MSQFSKLATKLQGLPILTNDCPLENKCLLKNVVYQATMRGDNEQEMVYIWLTERLSMEKYDNEKATFRIQLYAINTRLSLYEREHKEKN